MSTIEVDKIKNTTSATSVKVDRTTSDGNIVELQKDGTTVGSISSNSGVAINIDSGGDRAGLALTGGNVQPRKNGSQSDNTITLGASSYRFADLYLGGNIYLGGTGSANALDDYEEGTWTPTFLNFSGTTQRADYTKIGDLVHIQLYVSSLSSGTGSPAKVQNLPFVCRNNGWASTILQGAYSTSVLIARVQGNASDIQFKGTNDNDVNGVDIDDSSFFLLQVTYKTDS